MNFRARLLAVFLTAVLVPMVVLALFIRGEMTSRLTSQYELRVQSLVEMIEEDLAQESEAIAASLEMLRAAIVDDNRFRRAAVDRAPDDRRYLLDYAGTAMKLAGLTMLQIQDGTGRIISSGHFRNEFDRIEKELPRLLVSSGKGPALCQARSPDGPFVALACVDSMQMGNRRFMIVGGYRVDHRFLSGLVRDTALKLSLQYPGGILVADASRTDRVADSLRVASQRGDGAIVRELRVPFVNPRRGPGVAAFRVTHDLKGLRELRSSIDRWFLVALLAAAILSFLLVTWLASRISRPLVELSEKTSRIDLDRLDIEFDASRDDEIGSLSRMLGAMTDRLRASAVQVKDAERRATLGDVSRQVNHDIKNGLTPIRNVFRHLAQLTRANPEQLPEVFRERQETLESSIAYLESLATNYARLTPRVERRPCRVAEIVRSVVADCHRPDQVADVRMDLSGDAVVTGDPVSLRRILENLVMNAIDSLDGRSGSVTVSSSVDREEDGQRVVRLVVSDTGVGMSNDQKNRVFDDFYTTKENGTGLGLSIVRRLVMDLDGSISVESRPGTGSRFVVRIPQAGTP